MARRGRGLWAWCRLVVVVQGSFFGFGGGEKEEPASARRHSFAHLSDEQLETRIAKLEESMRGSEASAMAPSRLRLLADLKEDFEHRASSLAPGDAAPSLGGVAIWSLGRCATGTFADSVKESGGLVYCNNRKEGFGFVGLSDHELERCLARARRRRTAALTHVKPQHLVIQRSRLQSPEAFMGALVGAGFHGVVTIRRQNHLARLVSSFENRLVEWGFSKDDESRNHSKVTRRALKFFATPVRTIEWEAAFLERGYDEAKRLGMRVLELDFVDVVSHVCAAVTEALATFLPGAESTCVEQHSHKGASRRDQGLAGRIGPAAAALVEDALAETPYAWMLDLKATRWPDDARRPTAVAHPDGPRPKQDGPGAT